MLGAGTLGRPRGMVWGGRREEGSGWGTHVYELNNFLLLKKKEIIWSGFSFPSPVHESEKSK